MLSKVKMAMRQTNPGYDLVIDRLHLYYDMKLVTFGIDKEKSHIPLSSIYSAIYITASNIIPNRNCTSSNQRSEHRVTLLHTTMNKQTINCFKL